MVIVLSLILNKYFATITEIPTQISAECLVIASLQYFSSLVNSTKKLFDIFKESKIYLECMNLL